MKRVNGKFAKRSGNKAHASGHYTSTIHRVLKTGGLHVGYGQMGTAPHMASHPIYTGMDKGVPGYWNGQHSDETCCSKGPSIFVQVGLWIKPADTTRTLYADKEATGGPIATMTADQAGNLILNRF